ncbi:MAG: FISUMP domain-containing protein [Fibrobacter intestinalis]|uniref:FISUMP domain-containing protein n=1 Tax=Fibrobacter intestinalis TaxID=28122 RepID=UPI003F111A2C
MKTIKKIGLVSAVAFAMLAFSACDDSSSASSDETGTSSSSVETSDLDESSSSVDKKSSGNESTEKDKSSSSVKGSEPAEVSSSSAKETKNSSDSKSSSSIKSGDSSSSNKDKSSSSVSSSSSEKQSNSSEGSSSSSVKQSSSSVASSSSEYVPFDRTEPFDGTHWRNGDYVKFVDGRNNREYYYIQISGKDTAGRKTTIKVMAENLNIGEMVRGRKNQEDDDKIERYCYNNDTTNCDRYGGLYQWAEMMQLPSECNQEDCRNQYDTVTYHHQGICPDGWRLLTYNDFYIVVHADGNTHGVEGTRSAYGFGGYNTTGYSLVGAGYNWDNTFVNLNEGTYWHYPEENPENFALWSKGSWQDRTSKSNPISNTPKKQGFSVRCVMDE